MPTAPPDPPQTTPRQPPRRVWESPWWLAGTSLVLGLAMLAAAWIGGHPAGGVVMLGVMVAVGAVFLLGGRSETIRLMGRPDERWRAIDLTATAITGLVLITILIGAFLWELAHGRDGAPYTQLAAIAGGHLPGRPADPAVALLDPPTGSYGRVGTPEGTVQARQGREEQRAPLTPAA